MAEIIFIQIIHSSSSFQYVTEAGNLSILVYDTESISLLTSGWPEVETQYITLINGRDI